MGSEVPYVPPEQVLAATCAVCPAQLLRYGAFDVAPRPGPESSYQPRLGWRADVSTVFQAEASAAARFEPQVVLAAMRRVMSHELAGR